MTTNKKNKPSFFLQKIFLIFIFFCLTGGDNCHETIKAHIKLGPVFFFAPIEKVKSASGQGAPINMLFPYSAF